MKLIEKLNDKEIILLKEINIKITDKDYTLQEIIDISDKVIQNGEITAVEENKNDIAKKYGDLADKLIELEQK